MDKQENHKECMYIKGNMLNMFINLRREIKNAFHALF